MPPVFDDPVAEPRCAAGGRIIIARDVCANKVYAAPFLLIFQSRLLREREQAPPSVRAVASGLLAKTPLIHGTSTSLHTWEGWVRALEDNHRVITFDLPAFGLTGPSPEGDYTIAAYVRFVGALLDKLGIQSCVLGGNSLGGNVAWETTRAMANRIDKLILVDSGGYPSISTSVPLGFRFARLPVLKRFLEVVTPRSLVEASVRNVYGDPSKVTPELVDQYFDMIVRTGNRRALGQRFAQADFGADAGRIAELKLPTLIMWGGRDRLIPPGDAERFHHDIDGSRLAIFPDLGHVPQEEDPARIAAAVIDFLQARNDA
jgi:pimeloyl-ACP methyl ester carboxylesterase